MDIFFVKSRKRLIRKRITCLCNNARSRSETVLISVATLNGWINKLRNESSMLDYYFDDNFKSMFSAKRSGENISLFKLIRNSGSGLLPQVISGIFESIRRQW